MWEGDLGEARRVRPQQAAFSVADEGECCVAAESLFRDCFAEDADEAVGFFGGVFEGAENGPPGFGEVRFVFEEPGECGG